VNAFEVRLDTRTLSKAVRQDEWVAFLQAQRWFSGKGRTIASVNPQACCSVDSALSVVVLRVAYAAEDHEDYLLPLLVGTGEEPGGIAQVGGRPLLDALSREEGWRRLLEAFGRSRHAGQDLSLRVELLGAAPRQGKFRLGSVDQSNSWSIVGDLFVKSYRRLQPGENLDVEVCRFLTHRGGTRTPVLRGVLSVEGDFGEATLLSLQDAIVNQGTGWELACEQVALTVDGGVVDLGPWALLGLAMADLHRVLASDGPDAIGTLPLHPPDLQAVATGAMALAREVLSELSATELPPAASGLAHLLRHRTAGLLRRIKAPRIPDGTCHRQRIHGDIHLGQVLWDGSAFSIIDFEGEPGRAVEERRRKQSPAKDLAGMLRSFDYAARAGLPQGTGQAGELLAREWRNKARKAFRTAYEDAIGAEPFLPSDPVLCGKLVDLFELEKAFYELKYELRNRPDWVEIPMAGLLDLVGSPA
jgi:maltose alpha-D-glucosyltransferase/alpha-amylase